MIALRDAGLLHLDHEGDEDDDDESHGRPSGEERRSRSHALRAAWERFRGRSNGRAAGRDEEEEVLML